MHMSPRTPTEVSHSPTLAIAITHYGRDYQVVWLAFPTLYTEQNCIHALCCRKQGCSAKNVSETVICTAMNGEQMQMSYMTHCLDAMRARNNASTALATLQTLLSKWSQVSTLQPCTCISDPRTPVLAAALHVQHSLHQLAPPCMALLTSHFLPGPKGPDQKDWHGRDLGKDAKSACLRPCLPPLHHC